MGILILIQFNAQSQCIEFVEIDNGTRSTVPNNVGVLSHDWNMNFSDNTDAIIFYNGIWMGGFDRVGNLRLAAATYPYTLSRDYYPGPLELETNAAIFDSCQSIRQIWDFGYEEILDLQQQFFLGTLDVDDLSQDVLTYPASGNAWYIDNYNVELKDDYAPFFDQDGDGVYNPLKGDIPIPLEEDPSFIPHQFSYSIYNDLAHPHTETQGAPLGMEIQHVSYLIKEEGKSLLNNTAFHRLILTNKGRDTISNFRVGVFSDDDLGLDVTDDFVGCDTLLNVNYAYNDNGIDTDDGSKGVVLHLFLNKNLDGFVPLHTLDLGSPPSGTPIVSYAYNNVLNALWFDGTPITTGGIGYDPSSMDITNFGFPDNPNDPNGWSLQNVNPTPADYRAVAIVKEPDLFPGESRLFDMADVKWIDSTSTGLEKIDNLADVVSTVTDFYERKVSAVSDEMDFSFNDISLFPNPTNHLLYIPSIDYCRFQIYNVRGDKVVNFEKGEIDSTIDVSKLNNGTHIIRLKDCTGKVHLGKFLKM